MSQETQKLGVGDDAEFGRVWLRTGDAADFLARGLMVRLWLLVRDLLVLKDPLTVFPPRQRVWEDLWAGPLGFKLRLPWKASPPISFATLFFLLTPVFPMGC